MSLTACFPIPSPHQPSRQAAQRTVFCAGPLEIGTLRLRADHPDFLVMAPRATAWLVFPRTAWALERSGSTPLLVDPTQVLLVPPGVTLRRRALGPQGERCDWLALGEGLLQGEGLAAPTGLVLTPIPPALSLRARCLVRQLVRRAHTSAAEVRHQAVELCRTVFAAVPPRTGASAFHSREHRELVFAARVQITRRFRQALPVAQLASALGTSPYHLCRVFRTETGTTLHRYQTALRLAAALDLLPLASGALTEVGLELGFSSHSHFTAAFRRGYGVTPSAARAQLGCTVLDPKAVRGILERHPGSVTKR